MSETTKLLPCPFCGNDASIGSDGDCEMFYVVCSNSACFCAVGEGYDRSAMPDHAFGSREAAAQAWNTRAVSPGVGMTAEDIKALLSFSSAGQLSKDLRRIFHNQGNQGMEIKIEQAAGRIDKILDRLNHQAASSGECETCKGDREICATVPSLRHCEAATRQSSGERDRALEEAIQGVVDYLNMHLNENREGNYVAVPKEAISKLQITNAAIRAMKGGDGWPEVTNEQAEKIDKALAPEFASGDWKDVESESGEPS